MCHFQRGLVRFNAWDLKIVFIVGYYDFCKAELNHCAHSCLIDIPSVIIGKWPGPRGIRKNKEITKYLKLHAKEVNGSNKK